MQGEILLIKSLQEMFIRVKKLVIEDQNPLFMREMYELWHDDPAINPPVLKSSLGTDEINNTHSSDTEEEESVIKVSKKRKKIRSYRLPQRKRWKVFGSF